VERRVVSVIIPSRERAAQAARCVERCLATSRGYDLEVIAVSDADPETARLCEAAGARVLLAAERLRAIACWNWGASEALGDVLVLGADDLWFCHGWIGEMLERMAEFPDGDGLVGFNDLHFNGKILATHFAVSRGFAIQHLGGVLVTPSYRHYYCDNEANVRAKRAGRFVWAERCLVEHRHPMNGKATWDSIYESTKPLLEMDKLIYEARARAGFPDDFAAVLVDGR
jgi:glycosyltransferase involved in cell wall biosynthesis